MSRKKRETSRVGLYTVILRTKNLCFKPSEAKQIFFDVLNATLQKDDAHVFAYAVGNKDAYLIVKEGENGLGGFVKKLCISFTHRYKKLFKNASSVFYDRYLSEPLGSDGEMLDAIVKVHALEWKLGPKSEPLNFVTSYDNYFDNVVIDSEYILNLVSKDGFLSLHGRDENKSQFAIIGKLTDKQVSDYIYHTYNIKASEINNISEPLLNEILINVVKITKASARQIGRITKISLRYLWNLFKKKEKVKENK